MGPRKSVYRIAHSEGWRMEGKPFAISEGSSVSHDVPKCPTFHADRFPDYWDLRFQLENAHEFD